MKNVTYYEIVIKTYHGEPVGRIRFSAGCMNNIEESALYSIPELNNILTIWRAGDSLGSFGIDYTLSPDATFQLVQE